MHDVVDRHERDDDFDEVDIEALERAIKIASLKPRMKEHLDDLLQSRPWIDVAQTAAFRCQMEALDLKPWQEPPGFCTGRDRAAERMCAKLLAANLSQYEPDPINALAAKRRKL